MINLGLITKFNDIKSVALPTLISWHYISPILGTIMSIIMILVIYNTIVGLMYAFALSFHNTVFKTIFCTYYRHDNRDVHLYIYRFYFTH